MEGSAKDSQFNVLVCHSSFLPSFQNWCSSWQCSLVRPKTKAASARWGDARDISGPVYNELCLRHSWPCLLLGMWSGAWKDAALALGSVVPRCALSSACVCTVCLEMLVRFCSGFLLCLSFLPFLFAVSGQLLYFSCVSCMFLPVIDVCSLACVASKPQHGGDVSEILSVAKAAGSGAGTSCSAPPTLQWRRSWDSPNSSSVFF